VRLIGTAGHIDHGKSTLIEALTGTHPSRLPEERARGMTIDLGYAHLDHPNGYKLGVVDVPGHEKLVKNMVAGATGFELALWVVDAREGVMPQSLEHLQILGLLGVRALVPVVTKADLATAEQTAATRREVEALLGGSGVPVQPLHTVDSVSGRGIPELKAAILAACRDASAASDRALPYLAVDRVFSVKGAGTVVTGTLVRGRLAEGDQVAVTSQPGSWRVRSLNNHHARVAAIGAGHRVGVNLAGLEADAVRRGDVLLAPGHPHTGRFVNVRLRWVPGAPAEWRHGARLLFYAGCSGTECRLWGVVREGDATWAQIELPRAAPFFPGQRFILRSTSPLATVGGGEVLDVAPDRPRRVTAPERAAYARRAQGAPALAAYLAGGRPAVDLGALGARWMVPVTELQREAEHNPALRTGAALGKSAGQRAGQSAAPPVLAWRADSETALLDGLHRFVMGQPRSEQTVPYEQLARAAGMSVAQVPRPLVPPLLRYLLAADRPAAADLRAHTRFEGAGLVLFPGTVAFSPDEQRIADEILAQLRAEGLRPARIAEYRGAHPPRRLPVVDRVLAKLRAARRVVRVSEELMLHADAAAALHRAPARYNLDGVRAAEFGQALGVSRKYSIPYLEYLNRQGLMRREGDVHYRTGRES